MRLTTRAEADRIRERAESRAAWIDEEDLVTLGFYEFLDGLTAGVAAHHAGMLPVFKETVEELFEAGLVKVVFATETLSLGINMPARTVVIEDLWKFQGERHEILTPGEYTQLTGRAGRRGIDALGHAVVVYQRQVPFERVAGPRGDPDLRPHLLVPALVQHGGQPGPQLRSREQAHQLSELVVRAVPRRPRRRRAWSGNASDDRKALEGYRANLVCHLGDFDEYWVLAERRRSGSARRTGAAGSESASMRSGPSWPACVRAR